VLVRLPVARIDVVLHAPSGVEDLLLVEAGAPNMTVAVALLGRLVQRIDGGAIEWATLSVTDIDVLLLRLRQKTIGDLVRAEVICGDPECGSRVDITFSIHEYLQHHRPSTPADLDMLDDGWYRVDGDVEFRLPRAADQIAIALDPQPEQALLQRCVRPREITLPSRELVEAAMEAMAPSLCSTLEGSCPNCTASVEVTFDPLQYALRELREQASFIYEEVCTIAERYHWSEADILSLPAGRRARYAALAQQETRAT
jgi:hypothetical protein